MNYKKFTSGDFLPAEKVNEIQESIIQNENNINAHTESLNNKVDKKSGYGVASIQVNPDKTAVAILIDSDTAETKNCMVFTTMATLDMLKEKMSYMSKTASDWSTENPILEENILGIEKDTNKIKIGDGVTTWKLLPYVGGYDIGKSGAGEKSEIFNDYEGNQANGICSHVEGCGSKTGTKAFKIISIDTTNNKITLDSVEGLAVNNFCNVCKKNMVNKKYNIGYIVSIDTEKKIVEIKSSYNELSSIEMGDFLFLSNSLFGTVNILGEYAHAEGLSVLARGNNSHAEGMSTIAAGNCSHTEGYNTIAQGDRSHAEGDSTTAQGDRSHAEGVMTIASFEAQHVQGKHNVVDTDNKYAHIVGNGDVEGRSNAHTLDWSGNAWYAGNIKIGGSSYDDTNAKEVVTKEYVDTNDGNLATMFDTRLTNSENGLKKYIDNNVNNILSTVYKVKGSLNNMYQIEQLTPQIGDVWNCSKDFNIEGISELPSSGYSATANTCSINHIFIQISDTTKTLADFRIYPGASIDVTYDSSTVKCNIVGISEELSESVKDKSLYIVVDDSIKSLIESVTSPVSVTLSNLQNNALQVKTGDNIVYTKLGWDKLAATVDLSEYQTKLTFDNEPTLGSINPVTSMGIWNALNTKIDYTNSVGRKYNNGSGEIFNSYTGTSDEINTAKGNYSHAEGFSTKANGDYSHAEGYNTQIGISACKILSIDKDNKTISLDSITGLKTKSFYNFTDSNFSKIKYDYIHITKIDTVNKTITVDNDISDISNGYLFIFSSYEIGNGTYILGDYGHVEGINNKVLGKYAHAEGQNTRADSNSSHAEGISTVAIGLASHSEGENTHASGTASHAEGTMTTAQGDYQHVQGKFNITDTDGKYAHIVGNGNLMKLSNAHTLDWSGNGWYSGTIKVGGTSYDDANAVVVMTKTDYDNLQEQITALVERVSKLENPTT